MSVQTSHSSSQKVASTTRPAARVKLQRPRHLRCACGRQAERAGGQACDRLAVAQAWLCAWVRRAQCLPPVPPPGCGSACAACRTCAPCTAGRPAGRAGAGRCRRRRAEGSSAPPAPSSPPAAAWLPRVSRAAGLSPSCHRRQGRPPAGQRAGQRASRPGIRWSWPARREEGGTQRRSAVAHGRSRCVAD